MANKANWLPPILGHFNGTDGTSNILGKRGKNNGIRLLRNQYKA